MRIPPFDPSKFYNSIDLLSMRGTEKINSSENQMRTLLGIGPSVSVTISEESKRILSEERENLSKYGVRSGYEVIDYGDIDVSGELMMEHYWAMGRAASQSSQNAEDSARAIMSGYEAVYHEIMKMHETGDREFSSLYGKGTVTLEEDLEGLDKAFEMKLRGLEGYIGYKQSVKVLGSYNLENLKYGGRVLHEYVPGVYDFRDTKYIEDMREMMERARKEFIEAYESWGYHKFMGSSIISRIISENPDFSFKTRLLFF